LYDSYKFHALAFILRDFYASSIRLPGLGRVSRPIQLIDPIGGTAVVGDAARRQRDDDPITEGRFRENLRDLEPRS
jgi:hypothetical protein